MSKKQKRQQQQAAQRQSQQVSPAPVVKQDDSLNLAKTKVAHLISEIVGVAETNKEFLEAAMFVRRFNQAALNYHAAMNFEAAVASDGTKAPRKADVYWQGNVIASWEPGDHRNGFQAEAPEAEQTNVLQPGSASLNEQNGVEPEQVEHDTGITSSDAGIAAGVQPEHAITDMTGADPATSTTNPAPVEVEVKNKEVAPAEATSPVQQDPAPQGGDQPQPPADPDAPTVEKGDLTPAEEDQRQSPDPRQEEPKEQNGDAVAQEQQSEQSEKTAEELAAEEEAKKDAEGQQQ